MRWCRLLRRCRAEKMPLIEADSDTPQSLNRRLQREGQGFQMIKDALSRDVAVEFFIQSDLPLQTLFTFCSSRDSAATVRTTNVVANKSKKQHSIELKITNLKAIVKDAKVIICFDQARARHQKRRGKFCQLH
jgi:hypothetical protein